MYENTRWVVFNTNESGSIDFSQVMESSVNTLRLNLSGSQTFVKYDKRDMGKRGKGSQPSSVAGLSSKSDEYTHTQILNVLTGSEWVSRR